MRKLIRFFSTNSILVNFLTIIIIVLGLFTVFTIKKEARPPVSMGKVVFTTVYPGASPSDVEKLVTIPLEDELSQVEGIKELTSTSYTGISRISVEIDPDVENEDSVISALYRAVNRVTDLPEDANTPESFEVKTESFPVLRLILFSSSGLHNLYKASDLLENRLESLDSITKAEATGKEDPVFDVEVNPKKLDLYDVGLTDIILALKNYNLSAPAGSIVSDTEDTQIRFFNELDDTKKIEKLVIRVNEFGKDIKVRDVATVISGFKDSKIAFKYSGKTAIGFEVSKAVGADIIEAAEQAKEELKRLEKLFPEGVTYDIIWDDSYYVKDTLGFASKNALLGLFLVLITLFLGLNSFRMSIVTSLGIPISFLGSIIILNYFGYTLNIMTLIGIILVLGMIVDDSIVVAENIFHSIENGAPPKVAVVEGSTKVVMPVIAAISTTILAFFPLIFMEGIMGKFMRAIPVAVISVLVISIIECFLILPNHILEVIRFGGNFKIKKEGFLLRLQEKYARIIKRFLENKFKVVIATVIFFVIVLGSAVSFLKVELFSMKGIPYFNILIKGKENIPIEDTIKVAKRIEKSISKFIPEDLKAVSYTAGQLSRKYGAKLDVGTNYGMITCYFPELSERSKKEEQVIASIREEIDKVNTEGFKVSLDVQRGGPPTGKPVDLEIHGEDLNYIEKAARFLRSKLYTVKGLRDFSDNINNGRKEYRLILNQKLANELGISSFDIQQVAMSAFEGIKITSIRKGLNDCEIRVIYPKEYRNNIKRLLSLNLKSPLGTYVPLGKLVKVSKEDSPSVIDRINQKRYMNVAADITSDVSVKYANNEVRKFMPEFEEKYPLANVKFAGEEEETNEFVSNVLKIALIALIAIYMIVSLMFNNIKYPFFIVLAIPFGLAGAMIALMIHGVNVSVAVLVSMVGLSGVVVNDSILLVNTIKDFYVNKGQDFKEAVINGAKRRFRPIVLTSVTTLAGVLPAAYEIFGANAFMRQMSLVMGWGLFFSTLLTMFALPAIIYSTHKFIVKKKV